MQNTKKACAIFALAAGIGATGCSTMGNMGLPTYGGAALGGVGGYAITSSPIGAIGGAVVGGLIGNFFEPDCQTRYTSNINRNVYGDQTGAWQGGENMNTKCSYSGNNPPANLNAPKHLQHMQKGPSPWR